MTVTPSSANTVISPLVADRPLRLPRRVAVVTIVVIAALGAATVPLLARWRGARDIVPAPVPAPSESTLAVGAGTAGAPAPDTTTPPAISETVRAAPPPVARDTSAGPASAVGHLGVTAPSDARILVNGVVVADGRWRADTLKPGDYVVAALVDAIDGCESARAEQTVRLRAGAQREVTLTPRACGTVAIDAQPASAFYSLVSGDGMVKREGSLPLARPLILPAGGYHLTAQKPQCAQYEQDFSLGAGESLRIPFRLICAAP
jgi:hypothetical protein